MEVDVRPTRESNGSALRSPTTLKTLAPKTPNPKILDTIIESARMETGVRWIDINATGASARHAWDLLGLEFWGFDSGF